MPPVQVELHRHLEISIRLSTLLELAQKKGLEGQSTSLEAFRRKIVLSKPLSNLNEVIDHFDIFRKVYDSPEVMERVAFEVIEDCYADGTKWLELRYSPSFVCDLNGIPWADSLTGFEKGLKRGLKNHPDMRAGLICIATREFGVEEVEKTVEFFLTHQDRFIGIDLAGNEDKYPCRDFQPIFKKVVERKAPVTVHAGEASGPQNIWEAIELLGAQRIGHGIASKDDPRLMEYLTKKQICLEICPTSNWITQTVADLDRHPLPAFLRKGVPVSINTDDPSVFGVTLRSEMELCRTRLGMSEAEIQACQTHAQRASFLRN